MQSITIDWFHIVILLGATQGCFLAAVLATLRRNRLANRILAAAIFAFSIQLISVVYHAVEFEQVFPHFFGAAYPLPLLYGPLIYLYAVTASDRTRGLLPWDVLHVVPFVCVVLAALPIYSMSGPEKIAFYRELQSGDLPLLIRVVDPVNLVSGISYSVATIVLLLRHRTRIKDNYSSIERVNLRWLLLLALAGTLIWALAAIFHFSEPLAYPLLERQDDIVALAIAALVYGIGYKALRQPEIFNLATAEYRIPRAEAQAAALGRPVTSVRSELYTDAAVSRRYERSGLSDTEALVVKDGLVAAMEERHLYRMSNLTLGDLAGQLATTPHRLSEVLNSQLKQTFYDFVNGYRVREVQRRLTENDGKSLTLLSLALDAGFASKSTFNHVFKKHTGQTPSKYRESLGG